MTKALIKCFSDSTMKRHIHSYRVKKHLDIYLNRDIQFEKMDLRVHNCH